MAAQRHSDRMSISSLARRFGLRASAIRYYESIGLLPRIPRRCGQRVYDDEAVGRLSVIATARLAGLSLEDIRELFFGFSGNAPASQRWRTLSERKIAQLEEMKRQLTQTQETLQRLGGCKCVSLQECGERLRSRR